MQLREFCSSWEYPRSIPGEASRAVILSPLRVWNSEKNKILTGLGLEKGNQKTTTMRAEIERNTNIPVVQEKKTKGQS